MRERKGHRKVCQGTDYKRRHKNRRVRLVPIRIVRSDQLNRPTTRRGGPIIQICVRRPGQRSRVVRPRGGPHLAEELSAKHCGIRRTCGRTGNLAVSARSRQRSSADAPGIGSGVHKAQHPDSPIHKPHPWLLAGICKNSANEHQGQFSPDEKWVPYVRANPGLKTRWFRGPRSLPAPRRRW